jgi:hypothetical protein
MSFAVPSEKETPQTLWASQEELGGRILLTIPFGSKVEAMQGFVSIMGSKEEELPVLTVCVEKPTGGAIVSTIVFPSSEKYAQFIQTISTDSLIHFFEGQAS